MNLGAFQLPVSKKKLTALGVRLAAGRTEPGDEELYAAFLDVYDRVQQAALAAIVEMQTPDAVWGPVDLSGRTKTLDTLVQKLQRDPRTGLPYVRDVAGVRVVGDFVLPLQRVLADRIRDRFGCADEPLIDRLEEPMSGYRALHVKARIDGIPVEIQVRTRMQHMWAETFERVADRWGRQIRYGEAPKELLVGRPDEVGPRARVISILQELSTESIAEVERAEALLFRMEQALKPGPVADALREVDPEHPEVSAEMISAVREEDRHQVQETTASLRVSFEALKEKLVAQLVMVSGFLAEIDVAKPKTPRLEA